ncbi:hypothetical protein V6N12_042444 [Hibiscus sabdariffa]|uniref:Uncharacterized protein n=1 Tax=Hibiscus sabdariffa TaxID=183260 RepID=A0ABR2EEU2_9ROSI
MDRTEMRMQNQEAALKSLENQVGQISQVLKLRPLGGFPSDTEVVKGATHEQWKAISTRSDKVLKPPTENRKGEATVTNSKEASDTDIPATAEEDHNIPSESEEIEITIAAPQTKQPRKDMPEEPRPPPPFPQRLKSRSRIPQRHGVEKNKNWEFETAAATKACLAMMHNKVSAKKTDPGSFTIPYSIGNNYSCKAL